jgi:hypothetical protein
VLALSLVGSADAKDIFVNNQAGNDQFRGEVPQNVGGQDGPVRSIARALRLADRGDRIVLAKTDQPYRESITLAGVRHSGQYRQPFLMEGNGAILDGSAPIPPDTWQFFRGAVFRFQPLQVSHQQLFLDGRPAVRASADATSQDVPDLKPLQWCSVGGRIYFCVEKTKLPRDYQLSCAHLQTGVTLYRVERCVIRDLTVQGFQFDGIALANNARDVSIVSTECRWNGRCGISVGGVSSVGLDDCRSDDNSEAQLLTFPSSITHLRNSLLSGGAAPGWVNRGGSVYLEDQPIEGGRDEIRPSADQGATSEKATPE